MLFGEAQISESKVLNKLAENLISISYLNELPVLGFNSGKYNVLECFVFFFLFVFIFFHLFIYLFIYLQYITI